MGASQHAAGCVWFGRCSRWRDQRGQGLGIPCPLAGAAQHVAGIFGGASQHVARCVWSGQCTIWPVAWGQGLGIP